MTKSVASSLLRNSTDQTTDHQRSWNIFIGFTERSSGAILINRLLGNSLRSSGLQACPEASENFFGCTVANS